MEQDKAMGLFRLKVTDILSIFRMHGMDVYIPEVSRAISSAVQEYEERIKEPING